MISLLLVVFLPTSIAPKTMLSEPLEVADLEPSKSKHRPFVDAACLVDCPLGNCQTSAATTAKNTLGWQSIRFALMHMRV